MIEIMTAAAKESAKEGIERPLIKKSVIITSKVLITRVKSPNVIRLSGKETSNKRGRIKRFSTPKTIPAQKQFSKEEEVISGKRSTAA
jgi:hypothetical protein